MIARLALTVWIATALAGLIALATHGPRWLLTSLDDEQDNVKITITPTHGEPITMTRHHTTDPELIDVTIANTLARKLGARRYHALMNDFEPARNGQCTRMTVIDETNSARRITATISYQRDGE